LEIIKKTIPLEVIRLLDFGCGDGNTEKFFYDFFPLGNYYGVDISEKSIIQAIKNKKENSIFSVFNGEKLPFDNDFFDVIIAANVFHHIDFKLHEKIFSEIFRVLKPKGQFYLFEHNPFNPITRYIVKTCAFDTDAKLLYPGYSKLTLKKQNYQSIDTNFILFFPRNKFFNFVIPMEKLAKKIPLGAQYYILCTK
jgi:SAM-dependent methyltransferase